MEAKQPTSTNQGKDTLQQDLGNIKLKLDEVLHLLKAKNRINGENILDNQDVCILFNLTPRSLQRYRSEGGLPYFRIGAKPYYLESEVYTFLEKNRQIKLPEKEK